MRDVKQLYPALQKKIVELQILCAKNGISIGIGECYRTAAEQDALYAKGRTAPGNIVTNCKGSTYGSMHQWGVAFDFYLKMDVDGDGQTVDDAFNNATRLFDRVGALGQSIGLEWGGSWKNPVDKPHFQLPDWGSTATKLKGQYGTPENFFATWNADVKKSVEEIAKEVITGKWGNGTDRKNAIMKAGYDYAAVQTKVMELLGKKPTTSVPEKENHVPAKNIAEPARAKNTSYSRAYITTANLNLRMGAGKNRNVVLTIPKGQKVQCYGYYTDNWLLVAYGKYVGYVSASYLK